MVQRAQSGDRLPPPSFLYPQRKMVPAGPGIMTLTTVGTKVPGMSFSMTVTQPGAYFIATFVVQFDMTVAAVTSCQAQMKVDGAYRPEIAKWNPGNTTVGEATVMQQAEGAIAPGTHDFEVWAVKTSAAGTHRLMPVHSTLLVQTFE